MDNICNNLNEGWSSSGWKSPEYFTLHMCCVYMSASLNLHFLSFLWGKTRKGWSVTIRIICLCHQLPQKCVETPTISMPIALCCHECYMTRSSCYDFQSCYTRALNWKSEYSLVLLSYCCEIILLMNKKINWTIIINQLKIDIRHFNILFPKQKPLLHRRGVTSSTPI